VVGPLHQQQTAELLLLLLQPAAPPQPQRAGAAADGSSTNGHSSSGNDGRARTTAARSSSSSSSSAAVQQHTLHQAGDHNSGSARQQPPSSNGTSRQRAPNQQPRRQQGGLSDAAVLVQQLQECRSPSRLLGLLSAHAADCDAVAVSAALLRYAKLLTPAGAGPQPPCSSRDSLQPSTTAAAAAAAAVAGGGSRQGLVQAGAAAADAARRRLQPSAAHPTSSSNGSSRALPPLLRCLLLLHLPQYGPRQYANSLYALARMHCRDGVAVRLLLHGLNPARLARLTAQELANVAWALGRLRLWPQQHWMAALFQASSGLMQQQQQQQHEAANAHQQQQQTRQLRCYQPFKPQEVANLVWGLGRLHAAAPAEWLQQQLLPLVAQQLPAFSPQQLSNLVLGLARLGGPRRREWQQQALRATDSSSLQAVLPADAGATPPAAATVVPAGALLPPGMLSAVADAAMQQLPAFNAQELSCLLHGLTQLRQQQQQQQQVPGQVSDVVPLQLLQLAEAACWQLVGSDESSSQPLGGGADGSSSRRSSSSSMWKQVRPSHIARLLHAVRCFGTAAAAAVPKPPDVQHRPERPQLPQQLLQQLAVVLLGWPPGAAASLHKHNSDSNGSSSSGGGLFAVSLSARELPAFCQALLLLTQLGLRPSRQYMSVLLEALHDKLHALQARDCEAVTAALQGLGYLPPRPWLCSYLQAVQPRLSGMRPEGLAALLVWVLGAQGCYQRAAATQQHQQQRVPSLQAGMQLPAGTSIPSSSSSSLPPPGWMQGLLAQLRLRVASRQAAAGDAGAADGASATVAMYNSEALELWLQQRLGSSSSSSSSSAAGDADGAPPWQVREQGRVARGASPMNVMATADLLTIQ
jgi:hypothetical protein